MRRENKTYVVDLKHDGIRALGAQWPCALALPSGSRRGARVGVYQCAVRLERRRVRLNACEEGVLVRHVACKHGEYGAYVIECRM